MNARHPTHNINNASTANTALTEGHSDSVPKLAAKGQQKLCNKLPTPETLLTGWSLPAISSGWCHPGLHHQGRHILTICSAHCKLTDSPSFPPLTVACMKLHWAGCATVCPCTKWCQRGLTPAAGCRLPAPSAQHRSYLASLTLHCHQPVMGQFDGQFNCKFMQPPLAQLPHTC